jgi:hypothetical protein
MNGTRVGGWDIDLPALYGDEWARRSEWWRHDLFEAPSAGHAVVFYRIDEFSVQKYSGRVAVVRNRAAPEITFRPEGFFCYLDRLSTIEFDGAGKLASLWTQPIQIVHGWREPRRRTIDLELGRFVD